MKGVQKKGAYPCEVDFVPVAIRTGESGILIPCLCHNTLLKKGYLIVVKGFELLFYCLFPNLRFCANSHALLVHSGTS